MFACIVGIRPVHLAVEGGHSDVVKCLLERGCNVNEPSFDGTTPLHIACEFGHLAIVSCFLIIIIVIIQMFVKLTMSARRQNLRHRIDAE